MFTDMMISTETMIDHQHDNYHAELSDLFRRYKKRQIDKKELIKSFQYSIKKRFNFNTTLVIKEGEANAYAKPAFLDETHVLFGRYFRLEDEKVKQMYYRELARMSKDRVVDIARGRVDATGMLDYKNAKVSGLFSQLEIETGIYTELLEVCEPEEVAAIMLHEIGHVWTFLSFVGTHHYRNVILANTASELMGTKSDTETIKIIINKRNIWGLDVPAEQLQNLDKEECTKVIIGAMHRKFTNDVGYVQYDNNTSEILADQFAIRMGCGKWGVSGLSKIVDSQTAVNISSSTIWLLMLTGGLTLATVGLVTLAAGGAISLIFGTILTLGSVSLMSQLVGMDNGWTYDNIKDRFIRQRNELVSRLKKSSVPVEVKLAIVNEIEIIEKYINKQSQFWTIPSWLWKLVSSDARLQNEKKLYQQTIEELLANKLYVQSAKLKQYQL